MKPLNITAAVLFETNKPLVITDKIIAPELLPGQVLVKVAYSGLCHSQLMEVRGKRGEDKFLPHMLGHEGSGTVVDVGLGVSKVNVNDKVILGWIKGIGMDAPGTRYKHGNIIINAGGVTTLSNYAIVSENRCVKLPDGIPLDVAVLFGCAIPTGSGMVMNHINPAPGSSFVVFGLGGIGLSALMATQLYEPAMVIAVDVEESKLQIAHEFGATHTINSMKSDILSEILSITQGKGADFCIEAAGLAATIETAFKSVRKFGGLCVFASHPKNGDKITIDPYDLICGKRLEGSWGGESKPDRDIPRLAELYIQGKLPLEKMLSHRYGLSQINQAMDGLEQRKIVRALIETDK